MAKFVREQNAAINGDRFGVATFAAVGYAALTHLSPLVATAVAVAAAPLSYVASKLARNVQLLVAPVTQAEILLASKLPDDRWTIAASANTLSARFSRDEKAQDKTLDYGMPAQTPPTLKTHSNDLEVVFDMKSRRPSVREIQSEFGSWTVSSVKSVRDVSSNLPAEARTAVSAMRSVARREYRSNQEPAQSV